jgi:lipopolysaccharide transport system ATP-binding protein
MSEAIRVENLSKQYLLGSASQGYHTLRETLANSTRWAWDRLFRRVSAPSRPKGPNGEGTFWALKDVSFEVRPGEVIGIIGRNGAGKSTLLKILSRITEPSYGRVLIRGRMGSLLEVGTGFHPELTGRENIYLNGAILGMRRKEIDRKFDEIVAFSEIEKFLDTPVKRYSSGMYVRLAFAVAAHLEPEILVVDEVLAVGDASFQKKCLGKMQEIGHRGQTVLFVSHNMQAVQSLCDRAVWLDHGQVREIGPAQSLVASYLRTSELTRSEQVWDDAATAPGSDAVRMRRIAVVPDDEPSSPDIRVGTPVSLVFDYWNLRPEARVNISLHVYDGHGVMAFNTTSITDPHWHGRAFPKGLFRSICHIPGDLLNAGLYRIELMVVHDSVNVVYKVPDALIFEVLDEVRTEGWFGRYAGVVRPKLQWETTTVGNA